MWLIPKQCKQIRARENITRHIGKVSWCKCRHTVTCTISLVHTLSGPDVWTITEEKEGYVVDGHICRQNEKDKEVYQICNGNSEGTVLDCWKEQHTSVKERK